MTCRAHCLVWAQLPDGRTVRRCVHPQCQRMVGRPWWPVDAVGDARAVEQSQQTARAAHRKGCARRRIDELIATAFRKHGLETIR